MAKINLAPEIKKEYNRARKSFTQKAIRASKRGYEFRDRFGYIRTGQEYAQQIAPSLSSIVRDKEGKSEAELSEYVKQATQRIITERQEFYESSHVTYVDPITDLTFYGAIGKSIENRRNKEKFLSKGEIKYNRGDWKEFERIYEGSIEAIEDVEERNREEERKREQRLNDWTAGTKELLDRTSDNELEQEYDPLEFYSDRDDRGVGEPPSEEDSVISNVDRELERWGTTDYSSLESVEDELDTWSSLGNWTPTLEEAKRNDKNRIQSILNSLIGEYGREEIARRIQNNSTAINRLLQSILYASGSKEGNFKDGRTQVNAEIDEFVELVSGHKLTMEESARYTALSENNEINN